MNDFKKFILEYNSTFEREIYYRRIEWDHNVGCSLQEFYHQAGVQLLSDVILNFFNYKVKPDDIQLEKDGKPYFQIGCFDSNLNVNILEKLNFNISHSDEYIICAIGNEKIGCDIQKIKRFPKYLDVEIEKINVFDTLVQELNNERKILLWTIYESIAKCDGKGIPLTEDIKIDPIKMVDGFISKAIYKGEKYIILTKDFCEKYFLSVCLNYSVCFD